MSEFKIEEAGGTLRPLVLRLSTTAPRGKNANPVRVTETDIDVEVTASKANVWKALDHLFHGIKATCDAIAGADDAKGEERTSRGKVGDAVLAIRDTGSEGEVLFDGAATLGKVRVLVDEDGEARARFRARVRVTRGELSRLAESIGDDVLVSVSPAQMDLALLPEDIEDKPNGRRRKTDALAPQAEDHPARE